MRGGIFLTIMMQFHAPSCSALVPLCCRWAAAPGQRLVPLPLACNITTTTPGQHTIMFSVQNSIGLTASVTRKVFVQPECVSGESVCPDMVGLRYMQHITADMQRSLH